MRIRRGQSSKSRSAFIAGALLLGVIAPTSAHGVADGTIACSVSGTFTVLANKVTGNTACTGRAVIPSGITEVSNDAFLNATGLTSAYIPNTVVRLGTQAFQQSHLTSVDFQASSTLARIESAAFQNIPLTSIVIPDSVTYLGNYQFWVDYSLTSVVLPANLRSVLQYTFGQTTALTSVNLPLNMTSIEANAFSTNTSLTNFTYCGLAVNTSSLNAAGLTGKTRDCVAAAISLSSTTENVSANSAIAGYTISSSNSYGGGVVNYSISPNISTTPGLAFDTATGLISGTPTTVAAAQSYTITAVNYASPSGTATFTITVSTPAPPPSISVPAPRQQSSVTGISPESATPGFATPVVISGHFFETVQNISINGTPLAAGSWSQTSNSISLTVPKGPAGKYSITLYNGSAPLLNVPVFTYTAPADLNWTLQKAANSNGWNSIAFGNGKFVAVGPSANGDGVMSSTDGKTWIASSGIPNNPWTSVAFGNGTFVAVAPTGIGNRIIFSKDGVNWTTSALTDDFNWGWVKYGNGLFVTTARGPLDRQSRLPVIYYSVDGNLWKRATASFVGNPLIPDQSVSSLGFGDGVFVITGTPGRSALGYIPLLMTSADGINWTWKNTSFGTRTIVAYQGFGCHYYVAMNNQSNLNVTANPENWYRGVLENNIASSGVKSLNALTYAGGLFLSVGTGTTALSVNAIYWKEQTLVSKNAWSSVAYGNGTFVAVASAGSDDRVMTSPFSPLSAPLVSEKVALGSPIQGFNPQYAGCPGATYSINPAITDAGLKFDPTTGQITGTPTNVTDGIRYTVSVVDGSESPVTLTYALTVTGTLANTGVNSASGSINSPSNSKNPESSTAESSSTNEFEQQKPEPESSAATSSVPNNSGALVTRFNSSIYFDMGSYKLSSTGIARVQELAKKLRTFGNTVSVNIIGFAQPTVGTEATDFVLSANRAAAVSKALRASGVTARIIYKGLGRTDLNTPSSRRVDIVVSSAK
jgi:outer membrane protein OmpA-like peptidoglycan-associated protein